MTSKEKSDYDFEDTRESTHISHHKSLTWLSTVKDIQNSFKLFNVLLYDRLPVDTASREIMETYARK